jgi:hypothetical protein
MKHLLANEVGPALRVSIAAASSVVLAGCAAVQAHSDAGNYVRPGGVGDQQNRRWHGPREPLGEAADAPARRRAVAERGSGRKRKKTSAGVLHFVQ